MRLEKPATYRTGKAGAMLRHALGVLLAVVVVLVQAVPGIAGHGRDGSSWIEICSDAGAEFIPAPDGKGPVDCDCAQCDCCLVRTDLKVLNPAKPVAAALCPTGSVAIVPIRADRVPGRMVKLWPEKRGPPAIQKSKDMTAQRTSTPDKNDRDAAGMGVSPCI